MTLNCTKGEWKAQQYRVRAFKDELRDRWYVVASDGTVIAENLTEANAELIVATPRMYEALKEINEKFSITGNLNYSAFMAHMYQIQNITTKALAKVEGKDV